MFQTFLHLEFDETFFSYFQTMCKKAPTANISTVVKILYYARRWMSAIMAKIHVNPQGFYPKPLSNYFYRKYIEHTDIKTQMFAK